jgi:hypothetical protein
MVDLAEKLGFGLVQALVKEQLVLVALGEQCDQLGDNVVVRDVLAFAEASGFHGHKLAIPVGALDHHVNGTT